MYLRASRKGVAREWRLIVCPDCWRAFEAMLDQGALAVQQGLVLGPENVSRIHWFL